MGSNSLTVVLQRYLLPAHLEFFSFALGSTTGLCIFYSLSVMPLLFFFHGRHRYCHLFLSGIWGTALVMQL